MTELCVSQNCNDDGVFNIEVSYSDGSGFEGVSCIDHVSSLMDYTIWENVISVKVSRV